MACAVNEKRGRLGSRRHVSGCETKNGGTRTLFVRMSSVVCQCAYLRIVLPGVPVLHVLPSCSFLDQSITSRFQGIFQFQGCLYYTTHKMRHHARGEKTFWKCLCHTHPSLDRINWTSLQILLSKTTSPSIQIHGLLMSLAPRTASFSVFISPDNS